MFEQLADRLTAAGMLACVAPPNNDGIAFMAARILRKETLRSETSSEVEINGFRFPVEHWSRRELKQFAHVLPVDIGDEPSVLLTDCSEIVCNNDSFVFHNNPVRLIGGCNPIFIRHQSNSATDVGEIIWNYYFGSPATLNEEWTVPINYFPKWDAQKLKSAFESRHTIGVKSWVAIERDSALQFRPFRSRHDDNRQLMIREDGAKCYVLNRTINEWLAWANRKGLEFQ